MMSGYMATILVADDDPDIAELVELHLADSGLQKDPGVQYDSGDHAECQGFRGG